MTMIDDFEDKRSLSIGDRFPDFELQDENGDVVRMSDLLGKRIVMFFYPKDNTSGCTREAKEFSEVRTMLEEKGILLFGISKDSVASHVKFAEKYDEVGNKTY